MHENTPEPVYKEYTHAPSHLFQTDRNYIITAGTYKKEPFYNSPSKLDLMQSLLFEESGKWQWELEAWALFANHYHFIAKSPEDPTSLKKFIQAFHSKSAIQLNKMDHQPGRKIWYQYWDTCITHQSSYLARLNYVHNNPVKHGLVHIATEYKWCSMRWFEANAQETFRKSVLSIGTERINVYDEF